MPDLCIHLVIVIIREVIYFPTGISKFLAQIMVKMDELCTAAFLLLLMVA